MTAPPATTTEGWHHRPALDGLRTVAVYLVVLFHSGSFKFRGGFVGVDVFFVLSGFLVTNVLLTDVYEHGRVRLRRFYARRARRLIPAASLTLIGTTAAVLAVTGLVERLSIRGDALASSLWFANWHFVTAETDYFQAERAASPFLHFWSLSIEEQFYVVFPVLLIIAWSLVSRRPKGLGVFLGTTTIIGIILQVTIAAEDPNLAYLATHTRFYQILAGATLAVIIRGVSHSLGYSLVGSMAAGVGLAGIVVVSTSFVDMSDSGRGLLATGSTVLAVGGLEWSRRSIFVRALSVSPITYLGRISYGTYLWHWPVLAVAAVLVEIPPLPAALLSGVIGTALAALSHTLVEEPIRQSRWLDLRPIASIAGGVFLAGMTGLLIAPTILDREQRPVVAMSSPEVVTDAAPRDFEPIPDDVDFEGIRTEVSMGPVCLDAPAEDCVVRDGDGLHVHILGDSYAGMMLPSLLRLAEANDWTLSNSMVSSCPWQRRLFAGEPGDRPTERCHDVRSDAYERVIPSLRPDVILTLSAPRFRSYGKDLFTSSAGLDDASREEMLMVLTRISAEELQGLAKGVGLIEPPPRGQEDQLACLSASDDAARCAFMAEGNPTADARAIRRAVEDLSSVASINIDALACPAYPRCDAIVDGVVARRDALHISGDFARHLAPGLAVELARTGLFPEASLRLP